jgi:hypothetical protein
MLKTGMFPTEPLERVQPGMQLVDKTGRVLGRVVRIQPPSRPVTHPPDSDLVDDMADVAPAPPDMTEAGAQLDLLGPSPVGHDPSALPDLPEALRRHLEEVGFVEIDGDLSDAERFIPADHLEEFSGDRVVARTWA